LGPITKFFGVQRSRYRLGRLHAGYDCTVQPGRCSCDVFVVGEYDDLEVLRQLVEEFKSLAGATVVEGDQRVVQDKRQRWFATCQAIGVLFGHGRKPERQEDLVGRTLGQLRRFERLAIAT